MMLQRLLSTGLLITGLVLSAPTITSSGSTANASTAGAISTTNVLSGRVVLGAPADVPADDVTDDDLFADDSVGDAGDTGDANDVAPAVATPARGSATASVRVVSDSVVTPHVSAPTTTAAPQAPVNTTETPAADPNAQPQALAFTGGKVRTPVGLGLIFFALGLMMYTARALLFANLQFLHITFRDEFDW